MEDKAALRFFFVFVFLLIIAKIKSYSNCPDAHADLELWWSYVFLDAVPYFMEVFLQLYRPKDLDQTAQMHMLIYNFICQMFLGHNFMSLSFFVFVFFFQVLFLFLQKSQDVMALSVNDSDF